MPITTTCLKVALAFLASWNITVTNPNVAVMDALPVESFYLEQGFYIRTANQHDCGLWVNGLTLMALDQQKSPKSWWEKHDEARKFELLYRSNHP